jgi:hypothetical protein
MASMILRLSDIKGLDWVPLGYMKANEFTCQKASSNQSVVGGPICARIIIGSTFGFSGIIHFHKILHLFTSP